MENFKLSGEEKRTFNFHLAYSIIDGFILGILALNEFIFVKSLKGGDIELSVLFLFSSVVLILSIAVNEILKIAIDKKKLLNRVAIITRLPLAFLVFFPHSAEEVSAKPYLHLIFLLIFLIYYLALPLIYPAINLFLKNSYKHEHFGHLYSITTSVNKIVMLVITFLYGILLDFDNYAFTYVFPVVALSGIISVFLLTRIHFEEPKSEPLKTAFIDSIKNSFRNMKEIIRVNVPFRHFEIGFMYYGFAFMGTVSIMTIFYDKSLHLNYSSVAFYRNSYNILAIAILPFFGKLIGKIDARRFGAISFAAILMYLVSLILTEQFPYFFNFAGLKLYYFMLMFIFFHGIFAATMALSWNIGSVYFCSNQEAADYHSIHLSLTGYRSLLAPFVGILFYRIFGFSGAFAAGVIFLIIAISIMLRSAKKYPVMRN